MNTQNTITSSANSALTKSLADMDREVTSIIPQNIIDIIFKAENDLDPSKITEIINILRTRIGKENTIEALQKLNKKSASTRNTMLITAASFAAATPLAALTTSSYLLAGALGLTAAASLVKAGIAHFSLTDLSKCSGNDMAKFKLDTEDLEDDLTHLYRKKIAYATIKTLYYGKCCENSLLYTLPLEIITYLSKTFVDVITSIPEEQSERLLSSMNRKLLAESTARKEVPNYPELLGRDILLDSLYLAGRISDATFASQTPYLLKPAQSSNLG